MAQDDAHVETQQPGSSPPSPSPFLQFAQGHVAETLHVGIADLPWVSVEPGSEFQLLHVDLKQGLWINRLRLQPGASIPAHYHPGPVFAVTLEGSWFYKESPGQVNTAGSYLFEPAGSTHTLTCPADQQGPTVAWFAIYGPNLNLDEHGQITAVLDAPNVLALYRQLCGAQGLSSEGVIVAG